MPNEHSARAGHLASVCLDLYANPAVNQIDLAIDILRVVHLAMRAYDFHSQDDVSAVAEVTRTTVDLLSGAREALRSSANTVSEGGEDAH